MKFECICVSVLFLSICSAIPGYEFQMAKDNPNVAATDINVQNDDVLGAILGLYSESELETFADEHEATDAKTAKDYSMKKREKRMVYSLAAKGLKTLQQLLDGAVLVISHLDANGPNYRVYQKGGNYFTALRLFRKQHPQNIIKVPNPRSSKTTMGYVGTVGDRQLSVMRQGWNGFPELKVTNTGDAGYADRIIFKNNK